MNSQIWSVILCFFGLLLKFHINFLWFLKLKQWCDEAGGNVTMQHFGDEPVKEQVTAVDDSNPYWLAFKRATDEVLVQMK